MASINFEIEVLSVSQPAFTKTAKGGYNSIEVAFKRQGPDGKWKVEGKKIVDFADKALYAFLQTVPANTRVNVVAEKGENDQYWKWVRTSLSDAQDPRGTPEAESAVSGPSGVVTGEAPKSTAGGRVTGSNYETADERAKKQVYIVRQSSISAALDFVKVAGWQGEVDGDLTTKKIIEIAREFEEFVFEAK